MRSILVCVRLLLELTSACFVQADDPLEGKRVVVIRDNATLEVSGKEVGKVSECSVFTVKTVQGNFLWIESQQAYLRRADVVPFEDAIAHYTRQLEINETAQNYSRRAKIWRLKGEIDIALGDMNEAIRLDPSRFESFGLRGLLWDEKKETDKAIADYNEAIRLDPHNGAAYTNRGIAWSDKKEYDKAIADYDEALKHTASNEQTGRMLDSDTAGGDSSANVNSRALTLYNRGLAWFKRGDHKKALADYEEAIWLDPKYAPPFNDVAWLKATCSDEKYRNGQQAIEFATKACELTAWKNPWYFDTLAASYAESGDFDKAVEWQQKAFDKAAPKDIAEVESRLKLYQDKKPYRQTAPQ